MHLINLPVEPPFSAVGVGLDFGKHIDEVKYCVSDNIISITCDSQGSFAIHFTLPSCWLDSLINALAASNLEYAGYELVAGPDHIETRLDEYDEADDPSLLDTVISYFTVNGVYPHQIKKHEAR